MRGGSSTSDRTRRRRRGGSSTSRRGGSSTPDHTRRELQLRPRTKATERREVHLRLRAEATAQREIHLPAPGPPSPPRRRAAAAVRRHRRHGQDATTRMRRRRGGIHLRPGTDSVRRLRICSSSGLSSRLELKMRRASSCAVGERRRRWRFRAGAGERNSPNHQVGVLTPLAGEGAGGGDWVPPRIGSRAGGLLE
jgi:hypothetical protein